jgi:hypothetical protein
MKQGPYREASSRSIVHKLRHLLLNQHAHHRARDSPPVDHIPSQVNQIHTLPFQYDTSK